MVTIEKNSFDTIKQQIAEHPLILYMKGTPDKPCCGFSARIVQILKACGVKFAHVNVLANAEIRRVMIGLYGQDRYLVDGNAKEVHRDDCSDGDRCRRRNSSS